MAAGDTNLTMIGNLVNDPELRFTPSGAAVAKFTVASTPRYLDKNTNEWKDGDSLFLQCQIWRQAAENVAESLTKGMRVIVSGRLKQRSYETKRVKSEPCLRLKLMRSDLHFAMQQLKLQRQLVQQAMAITPVPVRAQQHQLMILGQQPQSAAVGQRHQVMTHHLFNK